MSRPALVVGKSRDSPSRTPTNKIIIDDRLRLHAPTWRDAGWKGRPDRPRRDSVNLGTMMSWWSELASPASEVSNLSGVAGQLDGLVVRPRANPPSDRVGVLWAATIGP